MRILFFIPARGGSKGIKLKNLQKLGGITLVERAIFLANTIKGENDVVLSSDNDEILTLAIDNGVAVHQRSESLSNDQAKVSDVVLDYLRNKNLLATYDWIILLEPSSPLRSKATYERIHELLINDRYNSVITATKSDKVYWTQIEKSGEYERLFRLESQNRQERRQNYCETNDYFAVKAEKFIETGDFFVPPTGVVEIHSPEGVDINVQNDMDLASFYGEKYDLF